MELIIAQVIVIVALVVTAITDLRQLKIYPVVLIPAFVIALPLIVSAAPEQWPAHVGGFVVGVGIFGIQYVVSRGRWIGWGDVLLGGFLGALMGTTQVLFTIWAAYIVGGIVALVLLMTGRAQRKTPLPFGAILSLVACVMFVLWPAVYTVVVRFFSV